MNYWDDLMKDDEGASTYMATYGEGPGSDTRHTIGAFLRTGETVLDVGCGPGWNLDHFMEYGPFLSDYKGLDYSERFVRVANARNPDMYALGDCRKLEEPDLSWDVVLLQDVLEHTNGYEASIREALRVAKKRVIVVFWRMGAGEEDVINDDGNDGYGAAYSRSKWEKFLDSLDLHWMHTESKEDANRQHDFYYIDKEVKHG